MSKEARKFFIFFLLASIISIAIGIFLENHLEDKFSISAGGLLTGIAHFFIFLPIAWPFLGFVILWGSGIPRLIAIVNLCITPIIAIIVIVAGLVGTPHFLTIWDISFKFVLGQILIAILLNLWSAIKEI